VRSSFHCKSQSSIGSFASPKTRTTPEPEALQLLMVKTEVDGGGVLSPTSDSEVVAKPPTAIHSVAERLRQTLIHLPVDLHQRVRKYAFDQEIALSAVMVDAIRAWLDAREG